MEQFQLGGSQRGFLSSTSVSSSITHLDVILCLHLSSLLFKLYIYHLLYLLMHKSSVSVDCVSFTFIPYLVKLE